MGQFKDRHLSASLILSHFPLQVPPVNQEAVKNGEVLRVSNRTCESVTLVGNTLECTVPMELQTAAKELEVEVQDSFILSSTSGPLQSRRPQ